MRTSIFKKPFFTATSILLASTSMPAFSQEVAGSGITVSANVDITSDYRFRGISLSGGDIAVQGGVDVTHNSGFYIGAWGSSLEGKANPYGGTELDLYGGWTGEIASGVTLNAGLTYFIYPNGVKSLDLDYFEPYASISGTLGPVQAKVGMAYAWKQDALGGDDNIYVYGGLSSGIPTTPITINAQIGYTDGALAPPLLAGSTDRSGFDFSIGADYVLTKNLTAGVKYTGVDGPSIDSFTDDAFIFTLSASF